MTPCGHEHDFVDLSFIHDTSQICYHSHHHHHHPNNNSDSDNGNGGGANQTAPPLTWHAGRATSTANDDPQTTTNLHPRTTTPHPWTTMTPTDDHVSHTDNNDPLWKTTPHTDDDPTHPDDHERPSPTHKRPSPTHKRQSPTHKRQSPITNDNPPSRTTSTHPQTTEPSQQHPPQTKKFCQVLRNPQDLTEFFSSNSKSLKLWCSPEESSGILRNPQESFESCRNLWGTEKYCSIVAINNTTGPRSSGLMKPTSILVTIAAISLSHVVLMRSTLKTI